MTVHKHNEARVREAQKKIEGLEKSCQSRIRDLMDEFGFEARIVFYPKEKPPE